jgi:hypothetical protein
VKARVAGLVLLAASVLVHLLVTVPRQQRAGEDGDAYRTLRDQRRQVQARLARMERADSLRQKAAAALGGGGAEEVVRGVRRSVISTLEGSAVSNVRLAVRPGGRDQVAASVSLSAEGGFTDVVGLSSQVARAGSGLLLQSVTFSPTVHTVGLVVEAVGPRGAR